MFNESIPRVNTVLKGYRRQLSESYVICRKVQERLMSSYDGEDYDTLIRNIKEYI